MNITVYLGANEGNDPSLQKAVTELGSWIGKVVIHSFTVDPKADSWVPLQNVFLKQAAQPSV